MSAGVGRCVKGGRDTLRTCTSHNDNGSRMIGWSGHGKVYVDGVVFKRNNQPRSMAVQDMRTCHASGKCSCAPRCAWVGS